MPRGGKRRGAGRPVKIKDMTPTTLRLSADLLARADLEATRRNLLRGGRPCRAEVIRAVLDEHLPKIKKS